MEKYSVPPDAVKVEILCKLMVNTLPTAPGFVEDCEMVLTFRSVMNRGASTPEALSIKKFSVWNKVAVDAEI